MKSGAPLQRKAGLRRTPFPRGAATLSRTTRIRPVNPERRAVREAEAYGPHAVWIRKQPSAVSGRFGTRRDPIVAAHASKTRGAGGKARDLIPLLASEERAFHRMGCDTFAEAYGVDLNALATWYADHSPALHPNLAAMLAALPCCGPCSTRGRQTPMLLPDGSFYGCCGDPECRAELERMIAECVPDSRRGEG